MSDAEWEALCDGCGKCCLVRLEDAEPLPGKAYGRVYMTDIRCKLLDAETARCRDYGARRSHVPDCVKITPESVAALHWLPRTCAYRRLHEGRGLAPWHPLVSGRAESVFEAGLGVAGRDGEATVCETTIAPGGELERISVWPGEEGAEE